MKKNLRNVKNLNELRYRLFLTENKSSVISAGGVQELIVKNFQVLNIFIFFTKNENYF